MPHPVWTPAEKQLTSARIAHFTQWVHRRRGIDVPTYNELWQWSVDHPEQFWRDIADYFEVPFTTTSDTTLGDATMPGAVWFPGSTLNYVDQVFSGERGSGIALIGVGNDVADIEVSWPELRRQVAALATTLHDHGVSRGDRVVAYTPDIVEAVIGFLATASLGAVWASCGQEYPPEAAIDRLKQLDPVALIAADGYRHGAKRYDRRDDVATLRKGLPSLRLTIGITRLGTGVPDGLPWEAATAGEHALVVEPVPFDHPLWVLFSSGTTGAPKGIVHGHGGIVLEHLKNHALHLDIGSSDTFFWFTSPSWTMWNMQVSGLLLGATIVCHDGNPGYPAPGDIWRIAAERQVSVLGTSPAYLRSCQLNDVDPARDFDLSSLRVLGSTGSVLPPDAYFWVRDHVGATVMVASTSGGTDVCSAFAGGAPTVPVWPGELSVRALGVALAAFDSQHQPVIDEVGEMVVTAPTPSMPLYFWNDPDGSRYRAAYFEEIPGAWRHGDWISVTDRGSVVIHGRSDSTLNRNGIRMGSAEIYRALESVSEVLDSLVLGVEQPGGDYWMPLFVVLEEGVALDDALTDRIRKAVREGASPRHVPDEIIQAPGIPHTRTGKKLEVPIKRLLQGADPNTIDPGSISEPELVPWYTAQSHYVSGARTS